MDKSEERIIELEKTIESLRFENDRLRQSIDEYKAKEQNISNTILSSMEHANQLESSRRKIYNLDMQRNRLLYRKMEQIIETLYVKYPELRNDSRLKEMTNKFKSLVYADVQSNKLRDMSIDMNRQTPVDDPIKKLLHNIVNCFDSKKDDNNTIRTQSNATLDLYSKPSSNGFDFNEALHPTMELDEILKAFNINKEDKDNK